jgi:hypothetical protein
MGRPGKITVDYFPHVTQAGKTLASLESRWGNDGYAFWFKLLELIGNTNGFCYDCNSAADWEYLLAKTKVPEPIASAILDKLAELDAIDAELWQEKRIWSDNFVAGVAPAFEKRKGALPQKPLQSGAETAKMSEVAAFAGPEIGRGEETYADQNRPDQQRATDRDRTPCPSGLRQEVARQADTVFLKAGELDRLEQEFGLDGTRRLVEILDGYKTNHPDKCAEYRDDYKVIRSWVVRRYQEESGLLAKPGRASPAPRTFIDKLALMARMEQPEVTEG